MRGVILISVLALFTMGGCGGSEGSPEPPNFPELLPGASAVCEVVRQQSTDDNGNPLKILRLARIEFQAQDLDGAMTLEAPSVRFGGIVIEMGEAVPTTEQPVDCPAESGACRVQYTWILTDQKNPNDANPGMGVGDILCGPGGDSELFEPEPFLEIEIYDREGWSSKGNLPLKKLEE